MNKDGSGVIHTIADRENYLSRKAPRIRGAGKRGERLEQVLAANIDLFLIITSVDHPPFNNKALDRFLVAGESSHIPILILLNKADLDEQNLMSDWIALYQEAGYDMRAVSADTGKGLQGLKETLEGKKSLFWGHSGVGKSSLLNMLYPSLDLKTGEISGYTDRGKHTTVTVSMNLVDKDTFVVDTPGIREIEPFGIRKEDLGHYMREFVPHIHDCRFNTCTHHHEPGCAVVQAVEDGEISLERYESYLRMLETIEEDMILD